MEKENFDRLMESLDQALAYERGEDVPMRVTVREVPAKPVRKAHTNIMLDEDIIEYFKQRAALPNARHTKRRSIRL